MCGVVGSDQDERKMVLLETSSRSGFVSHPARLRNKPGHLWGHGFPPVMLHAVCGYMEYKMDIKYGVRVVCCR